MSHRLSLTAAAVLVTAIAAAGCSQSPQDRYDDAVSSLKDAQSDLKQAQSKVKDSRQQIQQAQQSFQQAQQQLDSNQQAIQQARQDVAKSATDQVLFRVLQKDVLSKDAFSDSAISVGVEQRVVTLTGSVPDDKTRQRAVKLVEAQPGVAHVIDRLQIGQSGDNAPSPANGNSNGQQQNNGQN